MTTGHDLADRVFVVTGCANGIGRATAELLLARGGRVIGLDRDTADMPAGLDDVIAVDVADPDSITAAVGQLPGHLDGLCNIAGVPGTAGTAAVRDINYLGLRHLSTQVLERMGPGGSIACASSIAGSDWRPHLDLHLELARTSSVEAGRAWCEARDTTPAYSYFKQALIVWVMDSSAAFAHRGVRLNCVSPGPVETRILPDFRTSLGAVRVDGEIGLVGRAAGPAEVAGAFAFLMSDDSAWLTGADIACDGGLAALHAVSANGSAIGGAQPATPHPGLPMLSTGLTPTLAAEG